MNVDGSQSQIHFHVQTAAPRQLLPLCLPPRQSSHALARPHLPSTMTGFHTRISDLPFRWLHSLPRLNTTSFCLRSRNPSNVSRLSLSSQQNAHPRRETFHPRTLLATNPRVRLRHPHRALGRMAWHDVLSLLRSRWLSSRFHTSHAERSTDEEQSDCCLNG